MYCFIGISLTDDHRHKENLNMNPYYMHGKHFTNKKISTEINWFFRIANGCILLDNFVDNRYRDEKYKKIDAFVRYPVAAETYFGVIHGNERNEDEELTKAIFGLTYDELTSILHGYAQVLGKHNMYIQYPRLTRSIKSKNYCDITDLLIPEQFPYVTFNESGYDFSHVSLWGFYRHTQLLLENSISSRLGKAFLSVGVEESALNTLLSISNFRTNLIPRLTRDTLIENW